MYFPFISSVLYVSAVLAHRRREHGSKFLNRVDQSTDLAVDNVQYSTNWAGAVWSKNAGTFHWITGTFTVPVPHGSTDSVASAWIGIDGASCQNAILQTGVDFAPDGHGGGSYEAWYEWYPDVSHNFSGITIGAGDTITLSINAHSATTGHVKIENTSNGQSKQIELSSNFALCGKDAEWIVEDPAYQYGELAPFANFGTVTFYDGYAGDHGSSYWPAGADAFDIRQESILTTVSISGTSVTIKYL